MKLQADGKPMQARHTTWEIELVAKSFLEKSASLHEEIFYQTVFPTQEMQRVASVTRGK